MDQHTIDKLLSAASKVDRLESLLQRLELQTATQPLAEQNHKQAASFDSPTSHRSIPTVDASPASPSAGDKVASSAAAAADRESALLARVAHLESQNRLLQQAMLASHERSQHAAAVSLHETSAPPSAHCDDSPHTSLYAVRSTRSASVELQLFEEHMARGAEAARLRDAASRTASDGSSTATDAAADLATTRPSSPSASPARSSAVWEHKTASDLTPLGLPPAHGANTAAASSSALATSASAAAGASCPAAAPQPKAQKASFRLLRADSRQCEYSHVGNGRISLGVRSTNLVRLNWNKTAGEKQAANVLIVAKPGDPEVARAMWNIAVWLHAHDKTVWVEPAVKTDEQSSANGGISSLPFLQSWTTPQELAQLHLVIDLVVCLGGDGTLLWASNLFKTSVPPVIGFALGSLGFLSPFPVDSFAEALTQVFRGGFHLTLRSRLVCTIIKSKQNRGRKLTAAAAAAAELQPGPFTRGTSDPSAASPPHPITSSGSPIETADTVSDLPQPPPPRLSVAKARHYSLSAQGFNTASPHFRPTLPIVNVPSPTPDVIPGPSAHIRSHSLFGGAQSVGVELVDEAGLPSTPATAPPSSASRNIPSPSPAAVVDDMDALAADDVDSYVCMNEVIVERGLSSFLTLLDCYVDGLHFTSVQADGIIVGTPTGSTAYSLSAGGSACHPEVPCMLFTPVCPHSLSFRPLLLPDTSTLQIKVSPESRGSNCASFDGRHRVTLDPGDSLLISMSRWPLPSICRLDGTTDWFDGVRSVLQWNNRTAVQKSLNPTATAAIAAAGASGSTIKRAHTIAATSSHSTPPKHHGADSASPFSPDTTAREPSPSLPSPHSQSAPPPRAVSATRLL